MIHNGLDRTIATLEYIEKHNPLDILPKLTKEDIADIQKKVEEMKLRSYARLADAPPRRDTAAPQEATALSKREVTSPKTTSQKGSAAMFIGSHHAAVFSPRLNPVSGITPAADLPAFGFIFRS